MALDDVVPQWGVGVLEVGHKDIGTRIEGVDDHFAVNRAGNFGTTIAEVGSRRYYAPQPGTDMGRRRIKVGQASGLEFVPALLAARQ